VLEAKTRQGTRPVRSILVQDRTLRVATRSSRGTIVGKVAHCSTTAANRSERGTVDAGGSAGRGLPSPRSVQALADAAKARQTRTIA